MKQGISVFELKRGFSLIETMIAMLILGITTASVMSTIIVSSKMTRLNSNRQAAKAIAQSYLERMQADNFANVGQPPGGTNGPPNSQASTAYANVPEDEMNATRIVWLDQGLGIKCGVSFRFKGYGKAESGSTTSLRDNLAGWTTDEWAGDTLYIVAGSGSGQWRQITSNSVDTLQLANPPLLFAPNNTSVYMINHGKTVEVTTQWHYQSKPGDDDYVAKTKTETVEGLIVDYRNLSSRIGQLGFEGM